MYDHILQGLILTLVLLAAVSCSASRVSRHSPLQTVAMVDLERYSGEWYEIARYPNKFQENCPASKATYTILPSGRVQVINECYDLEYERVLRSVTGTAKAVDDTNSKLKVTFFWPFYGDYWIIDLGSDYEYAVVGHPGRKYLWILARSKSIPQTLYESISTTLTKQGYDPARLIRRVNSGGSNGT